MHFSPKFAVLLLGVALPTLCFAQDVQDQEAEGWTPSQIIVTGTPDADYTSPNADVARSTIPLQNTPQSIQVLTRKLITDQELNTLDEALANVSGVVPSLASEVLLANPIVRGFESEIFMDGLIGYGDTAVSDPGSLWNVEQIEVAKGPSATLYGGGTGAPVGGLINLVSKTPKRDAALNLQLRAGSFDTMAVAGDANLPIIDALAIRLVGEYQTGGDNIDRVAIDRVLLAPSLRFRPSDSTDIIASLTYSRVKQLEYVGLPAFLKTVPAVRRNRFTSSTQAPRSDIQNLSYNFNIVQNLTDKVRLNLRVKRFENDFDEYASSPFLAFFPCTGTVCPQLNGTLPVSVREWTVDASTTAEFSTGSIDHVLLAGAQWDRVNYDGATGFDFFNIGLFDYANPAADLPFTIPSLNQVVANRYKTLAFYAQDQMKLGSKLNILASLRYSRLGIAEITGGAGTRKTYGEINPRIGLSYDVTDGISLFGGFATGSRLSIFFNGTNTPLPERSKSAEAGIKFALKTIGLSGTVAGYRSARTNVPTPDPTTFFTSIQTGKQRSQGVEIDLIYEPSKAISVLASYGYTDAIVTRDTLIPAGAQLPRVPKHRGRLAARYRVLDGAFSGLEFGGGMTVSSKAFMTLPNGLTSDSYTVFDVQGSYAVGPARLGVRIDNLFNADYVIPYQYFAQDVVRPGNPRSAFFTLQFGF
jgi:iron complex outermembrane recepter protein